MWRSKKVIVIAVLAAVLLAGSIGSAVAAKNGFAAAGNAVLNQAANSTPNNNPLMARVAGILGIEQQKLQDAFKQARGEIQNERLDKYLITLVEQGKITQAQADKFKAWWQSRPTSNQTTIEQMKEWMQAKPADVPLPRGFVGPGFCGPAKGPGPGRAGGPIGPDGMMMGRW